MKPEANSDYMPLKTGEAAQIRQGMYDMPTMRYRALEWVEKQIHKTRAHIGHAEQKPNVSHDEVANLYTTLETLEWISQLVLGAKEG